MSEPKLTEAQRETLGRAMHAAGGCECGGYFYRDGDALAPAVERILAEHTQTLEAERDEARGERDGWHNAFDTIYERHHQECQRVDRAEAEVRRLRTVIKALVVEIERPYEASPRRRREWADRLRALLDGSDQ